MEREARHQPVVALRELVRHGHEGQCPTFLGAQAVITPAAVHQAPLLTIQESFHQDVVRIVTVEAEGLPMERPLSVPSAGPPTPLDGWRGAPPPTLHNFVGLAVDRRGRLVKTLTLTPDSRPQSLCRVGATPNRSSVTEGGEGESRAKPSADR